MDTLFKDLTYAVRGLRKNLGFATVADDHDRARASAPARRSSASSTPCCCGRCRMPTRSGWSWCGASCARATSTTGRSRRRTIRDLRQQSTERLRGHRRDHSRRSHADLGRRRRARADSRRRRHAEPLPRARRARPARPRFHRRRCDAAAAAAEPGPRRWPRPPAACPRSRSSATRSGCDATAAIRRRSARTSISATAARRSSACSRRTSSCCFRRARTSSACPTCGPPRASTSRPRTATTSCSA